MVSWWTNVRFEKSFTRDLCLLLKASGCIAVSGGLEVASDRLLQLINKGITVSQVARVNKHFTQAGIMVHAYLMYGFPTQTAQETIDSLEMVRQMFKTGVLQSAYWHQFAMTAHSPVGMEPAKYMVEKETELVGTFANNDIVHIDPSGADHESFSYGLKKSLFNYMHNLGFDEPLQKWFEQKVPKTKVDPAFIENALIEEDLAFKPNAKVIYLGKIPSVEYFTQSKKGMSREMATLTFITKSGSHQVQLLKTQADWLVGMLPKLSPDNIKIYSPREMMADYETSTGLDDFEMFWDNKPMNTMWKAGLFSV